MRIRRPPSYLVRIGTKYYFRIKPKQNQSKYLPIGGELRLSLRTGDLRKARILASVLSTAVDDFFYEH